MIEPRRDRGIVESGRASRVQLVVDGNVAAEHREHGRVTVRHDDGSTLVIDIAPDTQIDGAGDTTRGAWSELRDTPDGHAFARDAVQPFTEVELVRIAFEAGARVVATGPQADVAFGEDGGPRDAPSAVPVVRAEWIAAGPDGDARFDAMVERRRGAAPVRPRVVRPTDPGDPAAASWLSSEMTLTLVVAGTCVGLGAMMGMRGRGALVMAVATAGVLAAGFATRRSVPGLWTRDAPVKISDAPLTLAMVLGFRRGTPDRVRRGERGDLVDPRLARDAARRARLATRVQRGGVSPPRRARPPRRPRRSRPPSARGSRSKARSARASRRRARTSSCARRPRHASRTPGAARTRSRGSA